MYFNLNLKEPKKEESLLVLICRWGNGKGNLVRVSARQSVVVKTWDKECQRCFTSKEKFNESTNLQSQKVNEYLNLLIDRLQAYYIRYPENVHTSCETVKSNVTNIICEVLDSINADKPNKTPLMFFKEYISRNRIDSHTGRYVADRTKIHHQTVLHRFQDFFDDCHLSDDWSVFQRKDFDALFTNWCYKVRKYRQNTVYASYGVLKPWLNAAKNEGYDVGAVYQSLRGKGIDVDNIYLTEDEISAIYHLDIPSLIQQGDIDAKSLAEQTRDLFIIGCWTGLRRSDLSNINSAIFDMERKLITITTEKTKKQVVLPMHPFVVELCKKYHGHFPHLVNKDKCISHMQQCARLAGVDTVVPVKENVGGVVSTKKYLKYQLVGMHTARRSFATNMYKRGFPVISIMQLTGHTTERNFLKYIKVTAEENALRIGEQFESLFKK